MGFDDLTLAEVELMQSEALNGKSISEADPLLVAGAVLWMMERKVNSDLSFADFKQTVTMRQLKEFSQHMQDDESNPLGKNVSDNLKSAHTS